MLKGKVWYRNYSIKREKWGAWRSAERVIHEDRTGLFVKWRNFKHVVTPLAGGTDYKLGIAYEYIGK